MNANHGLKADLELKQKRTSAPAIPQSREKKLAGERKCVCVCVREIDRERERERERVGVCEREQVCVCV